VPSSRSARAGDAAKLLLCVCTWASGGGEGGERQAGGGGVWLRENREVELATSSDVSNVAKAVSLPK
jgi:hypothetical protein